MSHIIKNDMSYDEFKIIAQAEFRLEWEKYPEYYKRLIYEIYRWIYCK
jgi:hypothetical protein